MLDPGSRILDPGSRILGQDPGSRILHPGSVIQVTGSRILDPGSRILDPVSWSQISTVSQGRLSYRSMFLLSSSWPSQLKHVFLRVFLASNLPKRLSKVGVLAGRSKRQSKTHCTGVSLFTKSAKKRWSLAPKHTLWNTRRISRISWIRRIKMILAQKCGQDPPFHTRRGPG